MRVVWAWDNSVSSAIRVNGGYKLRYALLLASVRTWKKYYSEDYCVLYCDSSTKDALQSKGFHKFWDEIIVVNFELETKIWRLGETPCWGFPKVWTCFKQTEPFIAVDSDIYLIEDFKKNLDSSKIWVYWKYNIKKDLNVESVFKTDPKLANISYRYNGEGICLHTCLMYFPDPRFAKKYARTVFNIDREMLELGCFEGKDRSCGGTIPWSYVMGADEETLYTLIRYELQPYELICSPSKKPVIHVERKYGLSREEYGQEVKRILTIAELPENALGKIGDREHEGIY